MPGMINAKVKARVGRIREVVRVAIKAKAKAKITPYADLGLRSVYASTLLTNRVTGLLLTFLRIEVRP